MDSHGQQILVIFFGCDTTAVVGGLTQDHTEIHDDMYQLRDCCKLGRHRQTVHQSKVVEPLWQSIDCCVWLGEMHLHLDKWEKLGVVISNRDLLPISLDGGHMWRWHSGGTIYHGTSSADVHNSRQQVGSCSAPLSVNWAAPVTSGRVE